MSARTYTEQLAAEGVKLLNFWRQAPEESVHAAVLLELLDLPEGAYVADLGCGTGEFARLAMALRPDIRFALVNNSEWQLSQAPSEAVCVLADMTRTGLPAETFDAVIVAYAAGHADLIEVLEEADRLLVVGGKLLVHDQYTDHEGLQAAFRQRLNYQLHGRLPWVYAAHLIGFDALAFLPDEHLAPGPTVAEVYERGWLDGLEHGALLMEKTARGHKFRDKWVGLCFSGGKDSLACLFLLKPWWNRITVYWMNTGDACPETVAVIDEIRPAVRFVEIQSDVKAWRSQNGMPSDLVPAKAHAIGLMYGMNGFGLTNRFDCCFANLMKPMHERMVADGLDIVIRGTKLADTGRVPAEGPSELYEVMLPLRDWSHDDVFAYLEKVGAPQNPIYEHFKGISAPECLGCTAWWDDGKAAYLKARHPEKLAEYRVSLQSIKAALQSHLADLETELKE
jgi:3'-phosphoadenosine 5'-phosphosulfate sulfotransferase (PAPS reductase)/FAD synthetase/protein-L-isoaspartate O-methyltransferase